MNVAFLQELLGTVAERGRALLPRSLFGGTPEEDIFELSRALLSGRGEASGVALAREVLDRYERLGPVERDHFFAFLAENFGPDPERVKATASRYLATPDSASLAALQSAVESPRQEFFRRLNLAPGATQAIVALRSDLMTGAKTSPAFKAVDADLQHLLQSWFNRGFLVLRKIDWQTPAAILEKIIRYEAVHAIHSWDDLRRRLDPADRRCFAFFHPSLVDEPLIFVEVALMSETPRSIAPVLADLEREAVVAAPTTAVFYSISNCQPGLKGISFGNFLLKQVVEELARETPSLATFVTLSPVPGFVRWLDGLDAAARTSLLDPAEWTALTTWRQSSSEETTASDNEAARRVLLALAAHYFLNAKAADGKPFDPVARFHLGNGASLVGVHWLADTSAKGFAEALGLM
ncbi:MAG: malonyl-CoA decarboxylase, partial [Hyphomicrobium sp.]